MWGQGRVGTVVVGEADDARVVLGAAPFVAEAELLDAEHLRARRAGEPVRRGAPYAAAAHDDVLERPLAPLGHVCLPDRLASDNETCLVSGAQATERARPSSNTAVAPSIVGPVPNCATLVGSRNVPMAAPMRLIAAAIPVPEALTSVGNISAGYTLSRSAAAAMTKAKTEKSSRMTGTGACGKKPRAAPSTARTAKEPMVKVLRGIMSMMTTPTMAPANRKTLSRTSLENSPSTPRPSSTVGRKVKIAK